MDLMSPILDSDNESDADAIELDTNYDFDNLEDDPATPTSHNIGSVWRDIVVGEQMEGCLTRLEVTAKTPNYTDVDDPNYIPMNNTNKRKRNFPSSKRNQKTTNVSKNGECDLESDHVVKKRYSLDNEDFTKCNYKYPNSKGFVKKRNNSDSKTKSRILHDICHSEEMTIDQLLNELCTNLHEYNKDLMLSVISKIDRKIILEKYKKTALIEANGGQMIKNGNRRRTSGGIFFNLIKEDKSIPNSAKKDLFCSSQNEELKKKKKREKIQRKKEKLKKMIALDKKQADLLKKEQDSLPPIIETTPSLDVSMTEEELGTLPSNYVLENGEIV